MSFAALQHMKPERSTFRGLCLPATFRPQGLVTLSTACSLSGPAGFVSHRRRSWAFPFGVYLHGGTQCVATRVKPTYRWRGHEDRRTRRRPGVTDLGFWVHTPGEFRTYATRLTKRYAETPLGFSLLGHASDDLVPDFAGTPLTRSADSKTEIHDRLRHRVSIDQRLIRSLKQRRRQNWIEPPL
jgi:hypothetical protein